MLRRILYFFVPLLFFNTGVAQRLELQCSYLTPGYTVGFGYEQSIFKKYQIAAGFSYLINNSISFRGSNGFLLTGNNSNFFERFKGGYLRSAYQFYGNSNLTLSLMAFVNYQISDQKSWIVTPYNHVNGNDQYLYQPNENKKIYFFEKYLGFCCNSHLTNSIVLKSQFGLGINTSPQFLSAEYSVKTREFAQYGSIGLVYNLKRKAQ